MSTAKVTDRRRYTTKSFPAMKGETDPLSFRCPRAVVELLDAEIAKEKPGIANRTDALQDAVVVWLMIENEADGGG
jgi:hypothetical protein